MAATNKEATELVARLKSSLRKIYGRHHDFVNSYGVSVSQIPRILFVMRINHHRALSLFMRFVTSVTRRVPLVEQSLLTLPEHLSSPPVCSGVRVVRSLVFLCNIL
jgi:ABC-type amino acid transport system permease subunit